MNRKTLFALSGAAFGLGLFAWEAFARTSAGQIASYKPGNCTDPNVAAYFSMDQGNGDLVVPTRCSAGGTVLSQNGSPTYSTAAPAGLLNAINFAGATQFFRSAGDVPSLNFGSNDVVIEGWINATAVGSSSRIVSKWNNSAQGWMLDMQSSSDYVLRWWVSDGTHTCNRQSGTALTYGTWNYFRVTWVNSTATCTLQNNGGTIYTATAPGFTSADTTRKVGVWSQDSAGSNGTGSIADLRITIGNSTNSLGAGTTLDTRTSASARGTASGRSTASARGAAQ